MERKRLVKVIERLEEAIVPRKLILFARACRFGRSADGKVS